MDNDEYEDVTDDDTLTDMTREIVLGLWTALGSNIHTLRLKFGGDVYVAIIRVVGRMKHVSIYRNGSEHLDDHRGFLPILVIKNAVYDAIIDHVVGND